MWIDVNERLPEKNGKYLVMRRAIGTRPTYEDECLFIRNESDPAETYWTNMRRTVINSVICWWEKETNQ